MSKLKYFHVQECMLQVQGDAGPFTVAVDEEAIDANGTDDLKDNS